jgi:hypothetical protein
MCDLSGKLIAWMDDELLERETALVEAHLAECEECRGRLSAYRQASRAFAACCDQATGVSEPRKTLRWVLLTVGTAAAVALLVVMMPRRAEQSSAKGDPSATIHPAFAAVIPEAALPTEQAAPTRAAPTHRKRVTEARAATQAAERLPAAMPVGPAIEIAIPSDAMFPPGAVPQGFSFIADVTVGADGSAERLSWEPRLVDSEGRATRP